MATADSGTAPTSANPFGSPTVGSAGATGARTGGLRMPSNVSPGVLTAAVGALLTFLAAFLTWATVEVTSRVGSYVGGGTRTNSGLEGDRLGKGTLVLALAALALCVLLIQPRSRSWGWIALSTIGGLIVVLALLDLVAISDASDLRQRLAQVQGCSAVVQCTGERNVGIGVYLTILGGLLVLVGALLHHGVFARAQQGLQGRLAARRAAASTKQPAGASAAGTVPAQAGAAAANRTEDTSSEPASTGTTATGTTETATTETGTTATGTTTLEKSDTPGDGAAAEAGPDTAATPTSSSATDASGGGSAPAEATRPTGTDT